MAARESEPFRLTPRVLRQKAEDFFHVGVTDGWCNICTMTIVIPIHSFVDLITNSSSEIFVEASTKTITAIKKMLDNVLTAGGSTKTADDLFTFELGYEVTDHKTWGSVYVSKAEFDKIKTAWDEYEEHDEDEGETDDAEVIEEPRFEPTNYDDGYYHNTAIIVKAKDDTSKEAVAAAKTLADLTGLFDIEAICEG